MKAMCVAAQSLAPTTDIAGLSPRLHNHVAVCLSCQAEMARYSRLRRQLASLADVVDQAPAPLVAAVEHAIAAGDVAADSDSAPPSRIAAAAGAVVAAAAGATAVALWRNSRAVAH